MKRVLFICIHNSARSQMAEEYLRLLAPDRFEAESAGMEPTAINPLVIEAMQEEGINLSAKKTQGVFELFKQGRLFQYVITVCAESVEEKCPLFPGVTHRMHLPFPDPSTFTGSHEEKLARVREVRDAIKATIKEFIEWDATGGEKRLGRTWDLNPAQPAQ